MKEKKIEEGNTEFLATTELLSVLTAPISVNLWRHPSCVSLHSHNGIIRQLAMMFKRRRGREAREGKVHMSVLLVHYLAVMLPASTTPATINPFAMAVAIMPLPRNPTVMPSVAIFYYFYAVAITPPTPMVHHWKAFVRTSI